MRILALALALALSACGSGEAQVANRAVEAPKAALPGRLVDNARLFDPARALALEQRLERLERATSDQFVVVSVPTLGGQPIHQFTTALSNRWGIGRADVDNGVVMLVAPSERKVWISVGTGLEGLLTDQRTQVIVDRMVPKLKSGDLPGGIEHGVGEIEQLLRSDQRRPQRLAQPEQKAA